MSVYTFTLQEAVEQAWLAEGSEQSEPQKGLYRIELARLEDYWMRKVGALVASNPETRRLLQTEFTVPVVVGLGACSVGDDAAGKTPTLPWVIYAGDECLIERLNVQRVSGEYVFGKKLAHPDDLFRAQPLGRLWWTIRNRAIDTIDTDGATRYTGSTLDGNFLITTSYIPGVATFPQVEQLQDIAVETLKQIAKEKLSARTAAARSVARQMR